MGQMLGTDASVPVAAQYPSHPITERFRVDDRVPAGALDGADRRRLERPTAQPLVKTSPQSWSEAESRRSVNGQGQVEFNADKGDKQGPITLAAAVSAPATVAPPPPANCQPGSPGAERKPETRVVAVGDSDFAANYGARHPGQPRPLHELGELAGAAGEPDRHSAARAARIGA